VSLALAVWTLGLGAQAQRLDAQPGVLVDRIAAIVGQDVITVREIRELEAYLRYRRDHARSEAAQQVQGPLMLEAYEEAVTRKLVLQRLKSDPEFQLARGRARETVQRSVELEGRNAWGRKLDPYRLSVERYSEMEGLTMAIQDYVRAKYRYAIVPTAVQIQQYVEKHPELKRQVERLSDAGKEEVRALIARQLEFQNFLDQYGKFIEGLRAEVEVVQVHMPEAD
jgi:hypothetical protein